MEPLAAGSGIPEVKTYLNGVHIKGLLTLRTLATKLSGITFSIAAGLIAGGWGLGGGGHGCMARLGLGVVACARRQ